jgi:hypothetical protein
MGLRYRKSFKLAPGVRMTVSRLAGVFLSQTGGLRVDCIRQL